MHTIIYAYICIYTYTYMYAYIYVCIHICYGVATISRLLKIIGLFCRILSLVYGSFAKETYNFKEPTNRSHPIYTYMHVCIYVYTRIYVNVHIHVYMIYKISDMGWLQLVGSINYRSLLLNSPTKETLFCKRDLSFYRSYSP